MVTSAVYLVGYTVEYPRKEIKMLKDLRRAVCRANIELFNQKLATQSWGNVSTIDRQTGVVLIKPSGVGYENLTPEMMVPVDLDGNVLEGDLNPSSDTPTHLELYRGFENIHGISHTHSYYATMWAQACRPIPCMGTTHADYFYGQIPVTQPMSAQQIKDNYEHNTATQILNTFESIDPLQIPAVLVANHGPFTWGQSPQHAVELAALLEQVAQLAHGALTLNPDQKPIAQALLDKHYLRKHGETAYYGQEKKNENPSQKP